MNGFWLCCEFWRVHSQGVVLESNFFFCVYYEIQNHTKGLRGCQFDLRFCFRILFELWTWWIHEICNKFYFWQKKLSKMRHNILKREYFIINKLFFFLISSCDEKNSFLGEILLPHSYCIGYSFWEFFGKHVSI